MYVIYLNCELFGVTASKEKAWETLADYFMKNNAGEKFIEEAREDFDIYNDYCRGDDWISFTDNIL